MSDVVSHPAHYGGESNPYEAIKIIEAHKLGFCLGNAIKYILRAGKKPGSSSADDLRKAEWYVNREQREKGKVFLYVLEIEGSGAAGQQPTLLFDDAALALAYVEKIEAPWGGRWKRDVLEFNDCFSWTWEGTREEDRWASMSIIKTEVWTS